MATYSINIVTIDRNEHGSRNYLDHTMRSLARSGLFEWDDFATTLWDSGSGEWASIQGTPRS